MTSARAAVLKAAYEGGLADFNEHTAILHPEVEWQNELARTRASGARR